MTVVFSYQILNYFILSFCSFLFLNFNFFSLNSALDPGGRALYKCLNIISSSHSRYWVARPIRIEYFKHVTELINSRPISVQDFMGVSTTCKTITKSLPTFPRHVRHTKSHVSTNFILTSYLALQSGRV